MRYLKIVSILAIVVFAFQFASAQELVIITNMRSLDYNTTVKTATGHEPHWPNVSNSTEGSGISVGVGISIPVSSGFKLIPSVKYKSLGAKQIDDGKNNYHFENMPGYNSVIATADVKLDCVSFDLTSEIRIIQNLYASVGVGIAIINKHTYVYSNEFILQNTGRTAELIPGNIPLVNKTALCADFGLGYDFKVSRNMSLSPNISYEYGLSNIVKVGTWKINGLGGGLSFKYKLPDAKK